MKVPLKPTWEVFHVKHSTKGKPYTVHLYSTMQDLGQGYPQVVSLI